MSKQTSRVAELPPAVEPVVQQTNLARRSTTASSARFHSVMAAIVASLFVTATLLSRLVHLTGFGQIVNTLPGFLLLAGVGFYCRWRGFTKLMDAAFLTILAVLLNNLLGALIQIAARTPTPLVETVLARIDNRLGLETGAVVAWISHYPKLQAGFAISYGLLLPMILAALLLPTLLGRATESQRYIIAATVAGLITASLSAIWPANGPWSVYGFAPSRAQEESVSYLLLLKAGQTVHMDLASSGIVTFPSFHVVLAILSVAALWGIRRVRWFALAIGTAVCISTLTTGWHFVIDVIGGICVAFVAQAFSCWAMPFMNPVLKGSSIAPTRHSELYGSPRWHQAPRPRA